jgi:hypothetical protein
MIVEAERNKEEGLRHVLYNSNGFIAFGTVSVYESLHIISK